MYVPSDYRVNAEKLEAVASEIHRKLMHRQTTESNSVPWATQYVHTSVCGAAKIVDIDIDFDIDTPTSAALQVAANDGNIYIVTADKAWMEAHSPKEGGYLVWAEPDVLTYVSADTFALDYTEIPKCCKL